jgi:predicted porin
MKKSTIVAASMLSCATAATAQSSVTLFGLLDAGVSHYSVKSEFYNNTGRLVLPPAIAPPGASRSQTALSNSGTSNSRLGFRGTEDLGGGLSASFWLEAALANDSGLGGGPGGAVTFNRRSTVSLAGTFGEIRLGRDYTPTFWNDTVSPFTTVGVGANVVSTVGSNLAVVKGPGSALAASDNYPRSSNSIGYFLPPTLGGFYGQLQYALHENVELRDVPGSPTTKGRSVGGRFGYASGPLDVALAYAESTAADTIGVNAVGLPTGVDLKEKIKTISLGASYNFGVLKVFGELSQVRDQASSTTVVPVFGLLTAHEKKQVQRGAPGSDGAGRAGLDQGLVLAREVR